MKQIAKYLFVISLLALGASILLNTGAKADSFQIITSPLPIKLTLSPGQQTSVNLRVKNQGISAEPIAIGLMKFTASSTTGSPNIKQLSPSDNYSWITFSPSVVDAQPNVWYSVKMTINVPSNAALGYYLAVTFSKQSFTAVKSSTNLNGVVATPVLINVLTPNEKESMNLVSFSADQGFYEYLPANFNVILKNTGNIYLSPVGNVFIYNGSTLIKTLYVNDSGGSILPNSERLFQLSWSDGFPVYKEALFNGAPKLDSSGKFVQSLKWDWSNLSKFRFGEYSAKLIMVYNNGTVDVPIESSLNFWVIPWKILLVGLLIFGLLIFGLITFIKSTSRDIKKVKNRILKK